MQNPLKWGLLTLLFCSTLWAQTPFALRLFAVGMLMEYKEYDSDGVLLDSEDAAVGDIGGMDIAASYTLSHKNGFNSIFEFDYQKLNGTTTYKGSQLGSGDPYGSIVSTTQNQLKDLRFMFKEVYHYSAMIGFKAGVGYGHHSWKRELSSEQKETYKWDCLRFMAGSVFRFSTASKLSFDIYAAYEYAISPTMSADIFGSVFKFDLGGVQSYEASVYGRYDLGRGFFLEAGYIFKQQKIAASNVVAGYYEPRSVDNQQFYKLGIAYHF